MPTLYLRDVSPEVVDLLKRRAAEQGMSLTAYAVAELTRVAQRPTSSELVERLRRAGRHDGPSVDEVVSAVRAGRQ